MFEERKRGTWNYTWAGIIGVVLIIIAVIQIFRVNPPADPAKAAVKSSPIWTEGPVLQGTAEVGGGEYLSFPLNFNRKVTFKVFFTTGRNDRRLGATIIRAEDLEEWKAGGEVKTLTATGPVPRGQVSRVIEPGKYYFILDNRMNQESITLIETDIRVE